MKSISLDSMAGIGGQHDDHRTAPERISLRKKTMAYVEAVCISIRKGTVKREKTAINLVADWGIEHDAHAGKWHRQVSLLAGESIDNVKEILPTLKNGAFAENIITRGLDPAAMAVGQRLSVGNNVVLEITQIGKECHNAGCAIKKATGDCIMPREGVFAKVIRGGTVTGGDIIRVSARPRDPVDKADGPGPQSNT
jgi:MOSC domain-containing protein YiiM